MPLSTARTQPGNMTKSTGLDETGANTVAPSALDRRSLILGVSFAACAGLVFWKKPQNVVAAIPKDRFEKLIPANVAGWRSISSAELILPPADELSEKLYENLKTRIYEGAGLPPIMFLIAYSSMQKNDVQVHRPEVCYPAAGLPIIKNVVWETEVAGQKLSTRFLVADRGGPKEMIFYWTRVGNHFPLDWREQRIAMAQDNLAGSIPDGALIRFSMIIQDEADARIWLREFATQMMMTLNPAGKAVFLGTSGKPQLV
jgi:EpsI family protein